MNNVKWIRCVRFYRLKKLWLNVDEVNRRLKSYPRITFKAEKVRSSVRQKNLPVAALPEVTIQSQQKNHWDNYVN